MPHRPHAFALGLGLAGLALALHAPDAGAAIDLITLSSASRFSSGLYPTTTPQLDVAGAGTLNEWNLMGRQIATTTLPLAGGVVYPGDGLESAWARFAQTGVASQYRAYAELGGDYLDAGPANYAVNELTLHNRVLVQSTIAPTSSNDIYVFSVGHTVHGFLLNWGIHSNVVAYASEEVYWTVSLADARCGCPVQQRAAGSWLGAAEVRTTLGPQGWDVAEYHGTGDWAGIGRRIYPSSTRGDGFELSALEAGPQFLVEPLSGVASYQTYLIDVTLHAVYGVRATSDSGFRSQGSADFSGTSTLDFSAFDASGAPTNALSFTLLPPANPVPEPATAALMLGGAMVVALARRRASHRAPSRSRPRD